MQVGGKKMRKYLVALLKFFRKEEYRKDFLNGNIYANSVDFLRVISNDINEVIYNPCGQVSFFSVQDGCTPITCFYSKVLGDDELKNDITTIKFSLAQVEKISKEFGNYATIITDVPQFINMIKLANNVEYGLVKYLDDAEKRSSNGLFEKTNRFSEEKEFRLIDKKKLFDLEKNKIIGMATFMCKKNGSLYYKLSPNKLLIVSERDKSLSLFDPSNNKMILLNEINLELYKDDFKCYTEEDLKSQDNHYIIRQLDIAKCCITCCTKDFISGVQFHFNGNKEKCNISNFIMDAPYE